MDDIINEFADESLEWLTKTENILMQWESSNENDCQHVPVQEVLRCLHSIKGTSAVLNLTRIEKITHKLESAIIHFINNKIKPKSEDTSLFLNLIDRIKTLFTQPNKEHTILDDFDHSLLELTEDHLKYNTNTNTIIVSNLNHSKKNEDKKVDSLIIIPKSDPLVFENTNSRANIPQINSTTVDSMFNKLDWSKDLIIGNHQVDFIHKKLLNKFKIIYQNFLIWKKLENENNKNLIFISISEFTGALIAHYEFENWLLIKQNLNKIERQSHILEHREELKFFKELTHDFMLEKTLITQNYLALMLNRLLKHIKETDRLTLSKSVNF